MGLRVLFVTYCVMAYGLIFVFFVCVFVCVRCLMCVVCYNCGLMCGVVCLVVLFVSCLCVLFKCVCFVCDLL